MIKINIDGRELEVNENITVLQAARIANIDIPTLCFLKEINAAGDCRMCIVEIEGRRGLVPSCNTIVEDGMKAKISQMTEECQMKLQDTLQKIINDSNGGMICIII